MSARPYLYQVIVLQLYRHILYVTYSWERGGFPPSVVFSRLFAFKRIHFSKETVSFLVFMMVFMMDFYDLSILIAFLYFALQAVKFLNFIICVLKYFFRQKN